MDKKLEHLAEKIRTKEELVFFLKEVAEKELDLETKEASELKKKLRALPEIKLEIAFLPKDDFIDGISRWLEREIGQKVILDITLNPKVVAGAIIEYQGNWRDFSLAKKIDQLFSDKLKSS